MSFPALIVTRVYSQRTWDLLAAIAEGLVSMRAEGIARHYTGPDGQEIGVNEIQRLVRLGWIDAPLGLAPSITPDGLIALREHLRG